MNPFPSYNSFAESALSGRYITNRHIESLLPSYNTTEVGKSEQQHPIYRIDWGTGHVKLLMWSQMHGNESTTTKALFDLLRYLSTHSAWSSKIQLRILPILNPDGAQLYTRVNANGIDLNRDAIDLSQAESRVLRSEFDDFSPDYAFNLHDQRSLFGVNGRPATVSLLAPSFDKSCRFNKTRTKAAALASAIHHHLQPFLRNQMGRFDDDFNANCVGDAFQSAGVPTLLIEAGHYQDDYNREKTREYIFYAYLAAIEEIVSGKPNDLKGYHAIPENEKIFFDVLLKNVKYHENSVEKVGDIGINYQEKLSTDKVVFKAVFAAAGDLKKWRGHKVPFCDNLMPINFKIEESAQKVLNMLKL
jgi:hypothetical protein